MKSASLHSFHESHTEPTEVGIPFQTLVHESVIGTSFEGRVVGAAEVGGRPAVITEIAGSAHLTGRHEFVLEPSDPLGEGFLLR